MGRAMLEAEIHLNKIRRADRSQGIAKLRLLRREYARLTRELERLDAEQSPPPKSHSI